MPGQVQPVDAARRESAPTLRHQAAVLPKACICGHDHRTHRDEDVHYCLECRCTEYIARCQNCGGEATSVGGFERTFDACSRRCVLQLEYALATSGRAQGPTGGAS